MVYQPWNEKNVVVGQMCMRYVKCEKVNDHDRSVVQGKAEVQNVLGMNNGNSGICVGEIPFCLRS